MMDDADGLHITLEFGLALVALGRHPLHFQCHALQLVVFFLHGPSQHVVESLHLRLGLGLGLGSRSTCNQG